MFRLGWLAVCVLVGCAGAHGPEVEQSVPDHDTQTQGSAPQQPAEGDDPQASYPPSDPDAGAPPSPAQGQDGGVSPHPADAGGQLARDAQAPARDASSDAAPVAPQADAGPATPLPDAAVPTTPDAGQQAPDAGGQDGSQADPMECSDVAPTDPSLELLGGAPFDCTDTAPCVGSVDNAALERAWCGRDPVAVGTGVQVRWWGYPTLLPEVQVPRSACVRIIAAGHCTLTSSFGLTYTKWARAPQLNVQGWVEVDVSPTGALACSLSCMGMTP